MAVTWRGEKAMTKDELVSQIAKESEISKKAAASMLASFVNAIHQSLKADGSVRIPGLGTFLVAERKARKGVNPRTQAKIEIPATKVPAFRAAQALKDLVKMVEEPAEKKAGKKSK
jgi:DNA-binding protein HU-beta